jgi:hypothetical protein
MSKQDSTARQLEAAPQDPMSIKPEMSLGEILRLMQAADEGMAELTADDMRTLGEMAGLKVDGYRYMISKYEAEAKRLAEEAAPIVKASQTMARKAASLERLLLWRLQSNKLERMPGERFMVELKASRAVKVRPTAEAGAYVRYADFMRLKYEWDKVKLTAALKKEDPAAKEIAEFETNYKIEFKPMMRVEE